MFANTGADCECGGQGYYTVEATASGTIQEPPYESFSEFIGMGEDNNGPYGFTCNWPTSANPGGGACGGTATQSYQATWSQSDQSSVSGPVMGSITFSFTGGPFQLVWNFDQCPYTLQQPITLFPTAN